MTRILLVAWYILYCLRYRAAPWRYFQLNAPWYDEQRGLFSKLDMDRAIPEKWRLRQVPLENGTLPRSWPVFLKPEWGQNGRGIHVAADADSFRQLRAKLLKARVPYLVQEAAGGPREFEVFYIRDAFEPHRAAVLSVSETSNDNGEQWPVHSILNDRTRYTDITAEFTTAQLQAVWRMMDRLGGFRIARIGLKSDSPAELLAGRFRILEINLFVPMPLILLDPRKSLGEKHRFIRTSMRALAQATRALPAEQERKAIFWPMLRLNSRI